jgi:TDG/mug DNA glycosylase family protein
VSEKEKPAAVLPDVLAPGLRVVFCGSAAGTVSARRGAYYAHPQNRFWATLHEVGLTPRLLVPEEFRTLPLYGIGLTDLAKHVSGSDASLPRNADDPEGLRERIQTAAPRIIAFNGKRPAGVFFRALFGIRALGYGPQAQAIGATAIIVLPSTSPSARAFWTVAPWRALARAIENP